LNSAESAQRPTATPGFKAKPNAHSICAQEYNIFITE
jgi:hypothetical protein